MRTLACFAAAFAAACAAGVYVPGWGWLAEAALCCAAAGLLGLALRGNARWRVLLAAAGLALGLLRCAAQEEYALRPAEALAGTTDTFVLEVYDYPTQTKYGGARIEVCVPGRGLAGRAVYYGGEALLACVPGDTITAQALCRSAAQLGDEADAASSSFLSKGIYLLLYNRGSETVQPGDAPLRYLPMRLARRMGDTLSAILPAREAGFFRALLLGDKSGLTDADRSDLSEAGLYHITAVSGLHCGFLLTLLAALIGQSRRRMLSAVGIPVLLFYALLAGATPSVLRACCMLSMQLVAPLFGRENDAPTSMSLALLLILLFNPLAIASISLQLSFSAMAGMLWLTDRLTKRIRTQNRALRFALTSLAATAGALVFSAPLSAYYFKIFVLVVPVTSLMCLWAASLAFMLMLPLCVLSMLLPALGGLAVVPLLVARYILWAAHTFAALPYHAVYFTNAAMVYWFVYVYALLGCCLLGKKRGLWFSALALSGASLVLTLWLGTVSFRQGLMQAMVLDVGQGQSVLLSSQGETALVDCGSSNSWYAAGDEAADYLLSCGVRRLDRVVLTHYHSDHANGLALLLARVKVDELLLPDIPDEDGGRSEVLLLAAQYGVPVTLVTQPQTLALGGAQLTLYPPVGAGSANERGLSILAAAGEFELLITGDMDSATERRLIEEYALPDIEVLVVGHHGSKGSSSRELLETVTPEVGVISVGQNSYGHPTNEAMWRLDEAEVDIYRTDHSGSVRIIVG